MILRYQNLFTHSYNIITKKNKNWLHFPFIVNAAVLKHQISKIYPQIQLKILIFPVCNKEKMNQVFVVFKKIICAVL